VEVRRARYLLIQQRNRCARLSDDDQFDIELLVSHRNTSGSNLMPARFQGSPGSRVTGKP
jgi:hypothetical protein